MDVHQKRNGPSPSARSWRGQHRTIPQRPIRIFRVVRLTISVSTFLYSGRSPTSGKVEQNEENQININRVALRSWRRNHKELVIISCQTLISLRVVFSCNTFIGADMG